MKTNKITSKRIVCDLSDELHKQLKIQVAKDETSITAIILKLVERYVKGEIKK